MSILKENINKIIAEYEKYEKDPTGLSQDDEGEEIETIEDVAGGNIDDAYAIGHSHGYNMAVQEILELLRQTIK